MFENFRKIKSIQKHYILILIILLFVIVVLAPRLAVLIAVLNAFFCILIVLFQVLSIVTPVKKNKPAIALTEKEHWEPLVSIHLACHNEPPSILKRTLTALSSLEYGNYEVLVIDNNTTDEKLWVPIKNHCEALGAKFRFFHLENLKGFKSGALNFARRNMDQKSEIILVVDADYIVQPELIKEAAPYFSDANVGLVQYPQNYLNVSPSNVGMTFEYQSFFSCLFEQANTLNAVIGTGTLSLFRAKLFLQEGLHWNEWCITEDAEVGIRLHDLGYKAVFLNRNMGQGFMPLDYYSMQRQRQRWAFGNMQVLLKDTGSIIKNKELNILQKWSIFSQLTAWIHPLFVPMMLLIPALIVAAIYDSQSIQETILLSIGTLYIFLVSKVVYFAASLKRNQALQLGKLVKTLMSHMGLSMTMSVAWIQACIVPNLPYNRTSKDPDEETPKKIPPEIWWATAALIVAIVFLLESRSLQGLMISGAVIIYAIFLGFSTYTLDRQLSATKKQTKIIQRL